MNTTLRMVAAACSLAVLLPALHFVVGAHIWGGTVVAAANPFPDASRLRRWSGYGYLGLAWLGIVLVCGFGVADMLAWAPGAWGGVDEDGTYTSFGSAIGSIAGLFLGSMVFAVHMSRAEAGPRGSQRLRQAELRD